MSKTKNLIEMLRGPISDPINRPDRNYLANKLQAAEYISRVYWDQSLGLDALADAVTVYDEVSR